MKNTDIAIVGMSCFLPGAENISDFWNNLINGIDSTSEVPEDRIDPVYFQDDPTGTNHFYCHRGGFIPHISLDPNMLGISLSEAEKADPFILLVLKLVHQALEDAQIFEKEISLKNSSVIIGKENYIGEEELKLINTVHTGEQIAEVIKNILPELSQEDIEKIKGEFQKNKNSTKEVKGTLSNPIASIIANKFNIEGTAYTVDASSVSSLVAVDHSIQELLSEKADMVICGGIQFSQNSPFWSIFSQKGILSHKQQMSPFSEEADGLLISEGAGFVILKKLDKALTDNDKIYAVIKGIGTSNNKSEKNKGQKKAILDAWEKANIQPKDVNYIEINGISTQKGDLTELETLTEVFQDNSASHKVLIGSVKSNIGHTLSASGITSLIKTALALYYRQIPPTLHCENPIKQLKETCFSPVQQVTDWDSDILPLTAGVSAFDPEGMNVHTIVQSFGEKPGIQTKSSFNDDVIAITASSKEALLQALDDKDFSSFNSEDTYRLVLFNPTTDRIKKAKRLISKEKYWKGRQDIWFSNEPLLLDNKGKIAFLFPGFDPSSDPEVKSIADYFGYTIPKEMAKENLLLNHAFKQFHGGELIDASLKQLGITPDMNAGHSLGEWFAAKAGGLVSNAVVDDLLQSLDPEKIKLKDVYFIAVGCGMEKLDPLIKEIPDLYLSNDNCPNQILLCGTKTALDKLIVILKKEQIFYQILTFQSGFHSPFIKDKLDIFHEGLEHIELQKNEIPIWSATTLDLYPTNLEEFKALTLRHLLEAVRFRELIEKLYHEEGVRVFIQVGSGSLIGFVDDTLKDQEYAAISCCVTTRSTLEQLRRVLALLFIEGREVDASFLGIKEDSEVSAEEIQLSLNPTLLIKDFPLLKEITKKYVSSAQAISPGSFHINSNHPVLQAINENIKELVSMHTELAGIIQQKNTLNKTHDAIDRNSVQLQPQKVTAGSETESFTNKEGKTFEENLYVSLETHPYVIDHSLVKQPEYWTNPEDLNPVIPMTMTFELLVEAAHKQDLDRKVLQLGPVSVFQWMEVYKPFEQIITGYWKSENTVSLGIKNYATAEVTLGDSYLEPPVTYTQDIDMGENIVTPPTPEKIYKEHMFHGPAYQGIVEVTKVTRKGLQGIIKKAEGKGSLLDNIGQLFGLYLQLTLEESSVSFPVKVDEINFYQDINDQSGIFEYYCLITSLTDEFAVADIIIKREGKIWCFIRNWKNQRFGGFDKKLWNLTMMPATHLLSKEIAPQVYFFDNAYNKAVNWDFIMRIHLNQEEKQHYRSLQLNKRKDYLISRVVLKDASRAYIQKHFGKQYFPIEFNFQYDSNHKPSVHGVKETEGLEISLAHKGMNSVSIVSDKPVGIDIETIENRDKGFLELTFTEKELTLLKGRDLSEWSTRFWVAKEAYGKMLGIGLKGNPKRFEIISINGEELLIENTTIQTIKYNNFIIGWTL